MKSGWKTSEFWLALIGAILTVLQQYLFPQMPKEQLMGILAMIATYVVSRTAVKISNGKTTAKPGGTS